jgi:hypothetical protein
MSENLNPTPPAAPVSPANPEVAPATAQPEFTTVYADMGGGQAEPLIKKPRKKRRRAS